METGQKSAQTCIKSWGNRLCVTFFQHYCGLSVKNMQLFTGNVNRGVHMSSRFFSEMFVCRIFSSSVAYLRINIVSLTVIRRTSCCSSCMNVSFLCENASSHFLCFMGLWSRCLDVQTNRAQRGDKSRAYGRGEEESGGSRSNVGKVESPCWSSWDKQPGGETSDLQDSAFSWETWRFWRTCLSRCEDFLRSHTGLLGKHGPAESRQTHTRSDQPWETKLRSFTRTHNYSETLINVPRLHDIDGKTQPYIQRCTFTHSNLDPQMQFC